MMLCWFNNALGAYSENYSDSAAGRCQKLQTVGRHQPVPLQTRTMMRILGQWILSRGFPVTPSSALSWCTGIPVAKQQCTGYVSSSQLLFWRRSLGGPSWQVFHIGVSDSFSKCLFEHIMHVQIWLQCTSYNAMPTWWQSASWWSPGSSPRNPLPQNNWLLSSCTTSYSNIGPHENTPFHGPQTPQTSLGWAALKRLM